MKFEREYEAKTLLSEQDFYKLIRHYPNALEHTKVQTNYYFDTPDQTFKNNHSALRIRQTPDQLVLTAKIKKANHHQEIHTDFTDEELKEVLNTNLLNLPKNFKKELTDYGIEGNLQNVRLVTQFSTKRSELPLKDIRLFFDQVTFANHKDYELEVEAASLEKAENTLKEILNAYDIPFTSSQPKIARALMR